jgi:hypothetical protein
MKGVSFHVKALLELISPRDGVVDLWQGNITRGQYFVYGDRAGLLRLGLAILQYASEAQPIRAGAAKAPAESLIFDPPSRVRELVLQLDDAAREADQRRDPPQASWARSKRGIIAIGGIAHVSSHVYS